MILKLVGGGLVVFAAAGMGNLVAAGYARRPRELRVYQTALQMLQTEIHYAAAVLPDALARVGRTVGGPAGRHFLAAARHLAGGDGVTAAEAWEAGLAEASGQWCLTVGDREILRVLGPTLGASDRHDQMRHLALAVDRLRAAEEEARADAARYERMWRYLGFLGGLLVALILM